MAPCAQNDVLTRYLMFKVALKTWDTQLGIECIQHLSEATETQRSQDMMYACIREAQQASHQLCTIAALKAVAQTWHAGRPGASCLTSILRCGIRLALTMLDKLEQGKQDEVLQRALVEDTCKLFEIGKYYFTAMMLANLGSRSKDQKERERPERQQDLHRAGA